MKIFDSLQAAFFNIWGAKLRSFLAVLGILIGTASVVALVMSGELATQHALAQFRVLGTNLLSINIYQQNQEQGKASGVKSSHLTLTQALNSAQADPRITIAAPYTASYANVYADDKNLNASIVGATDSLVAVIKIKMQRGRFISLLDNNQNYAVIGAGVAKKLKAINKQPLIGRQVSIGGNVFTVVGVAQTWPENNFFDEDINNTIIIPISTSLSASKYTQIQNIVYRIKPNSDIDAIKEKLHNYINRYISNGQIFVRSPEQIIKSMQKQQATFTILLGVIGGISLLVGGIGVMNIMLVSVVERHREIGIRRAIGARQSDIKWLFLTESVALSLFGGIIGVIIGIVSSFAIAYFFHWEYSFFATPAIIGFAVSVFVGIFFGFYPAHRASKLDPILLLRSE